MRIFWERRNRFFFFLAFFSVEELLDFLFDATDVIPVCLQKGDNDTCSAYNPLPNIFAVDYGYCTDADTQEHDDCGDPEFRSFDSGFHDILIFARKMGNPFSQENCSSFLCKDNFLPKRKNRTKRELSDIVGFV